MIEKEQSNEEYEKYKQKKQISSRLFFN